MKEHPPLYGAALSACLAGNAPASGPTRDNRHPPALQKDRFLIGRAAHAPQGACDESIPSSNAPGLMSAGLKARRSILQSPGRMMAFNAVEGSPDVQLPDGEQRAFAVIQLLSAELHFERWLVVAGDHGQSGKGLVDI